MKLSSLLSCLPFYRTSTTIEDREITQIQMDDRKVNDGSLFICIQGFTVDGHDYAENAVKRGAVAVVAEKELSLPVPVIVISDTKRALAMLAAKFFDNPTKNMSLIGVTGTNGKTTITYLLEKIFNHDMKKTGLIGTIQMKIGEKEYPINNTTPDSLELQTNFKKMVDANVDQAIMEVSSHALDQGRVFGCNYDIAIFTNLSQDHLDYHKDMDDYLRAKSLLFSQLGNTYGTSKKYAIINEDEKASGLLKKSTAQHLITYGIKNKSDVMASNIELGITQTKFTLETPVGNVDILSRLIGNFNIYNMLAAASAALAREVPLNVIKEALEVVTGVNGRFEPVLADQPYAVIVDYAHTPDSLDNVLETIKGFAKRNIYVVVGCGGDRDRTKRPLMAQIAVKYADKAIFTSDNPRTEDPEEIIKDMVTGLNKDALNYHVVVNRKQAINEAINMAKEDDVILIAGKGHETYQQIGHEKHDFDDHKVAEEAIRNKGK
ncbi:UDP-N-acetylmuramoyl-L-alanyl-D-glutamate--2,6-diaminopimelate ligase [Virgibacillus sp. MSJ-26]|uniref:UDP-N-acetylmuramoyl-L-alanyl-D-glutamate--2, 6-diaminopimelate ligase n=1 Tax=Virgibacillus sp. MSJ-26 TaxID=2841522 RepID=UPI001C0F7C46|nr:UDP-N-acetylmuramoyl-L-alanyl-D-glutamate--2,6-diaminopimelate ligase [Virgibacillus sp. MSJ-26]MBU5467739.1 UDP-N-acetylmuramoyl-L-alanyl-D-glutamate--2,6-diaminopimelate ligase [Virgibacillus sp. MSJ-26]